MKKRTLLTVTLALVSICGMTLYVSCTPKTAEYYFDLGAGNYLRDNEKAILYFTKAIRLDPNYAEAYSWRGLTYNSQGKYDEAIRDYTEAIRLDANDAWAYYSWRGDTYNSQGKYDEAISDYTEAIRLAPDDYWAREKRGDLYFQNENYDLAIADYEAALLIYPLKEKLEIAKNVNVQQHGQQMPLNQVAPHRSAFFQEGTGKTIVIGELYTYWLYQCSPNDREELIGYLHSYVESIGYIVDHDSFYYMDENPQLAISVRRLMNQQGRNVSVTMKHNALIINIDMEEKGPLPDRKYYFMSWNLIKG